MENFVPAVLAAGGSLKPIIAGREVKTGSLNPGLCAHDGKMYVNLRHVEYVLYHSEGQQRFNSFWGPLSYIHPENDPRLVTYNYFGEYRNGEFNLHKIDTSKLDVKPIWTFVGLEDARVVVWNDTIYLCGVRRDTTTNGQGRMELSELQRTDTGWAEVKRYRLEAPVDTNSYCEKNWMPVKDRPFHFVKWANPTEVVVADLSITHENGNYVTHQLKEPGGGVQLPRDLRGGSNVIPVNGSYMAITHEVDFWYNYKGNKDAQYYHRIVEWDRDFNITRISEPFKFLGGFIEFCTGMEYSNGTFAITFGFQDNVAYYLEVPEQLIFDKLKQAQ